MFWNMFVMVEGRFRCDCVSLLFRYSSDMISLFRMVFIGCRWLMKVMMMVVKL